MLHHLESSWFNYWSTALQLFGLHSVIGRVTFLPQSFSILIPSSLPFLSKVLDPEKQADLLDSLRICLLQFSTLLVEHAPHHIHDNNKSRNSKLRRLMTFAWPCLLPKACVDPACKYSGHLLLAHIIAKFAIHKKIVLQVSLECGLDFNMQTEQNYVTILKRINANCFVLG